MKQAVGFTVVLLALVLAPLNALAGASTYRATSPLAPVVRDLAPMPGTSVRAFFPRLSATIQTRGNALRATSLRLYLDGNDVSKSISLSGNALSFVPRERLQAGWHDVFLEGSDTANHSFSQAWIFASTDPDVDLPIGDDAGFAFVPVGLNGPFTHFFLISPFEGFGLVQLCGLEVPLLRANGTPVFFVTVPVTLGSALLDCNPGLVFTPFQAGIGQLNPIFFPIEIAGPGIANGAPPGRHPLTPAHTMPVYRAPAIPVSGTSAIPVYRSSAIPVYQSTTMPVYRSSVMPVYRAPGVIPGKPAAIPAAPHVSVPHPGIPH